MKNMKKSKTMQFFAGFWALVMTLLVLPVFPLTVTAETETSDLRKMDYTPFLIESVDGKAVYNAQTADMTYKFYDSVENAMSGSLKQDNIQNFTTVAEGVFSFEDYPIESVYAYYPAWAPSCGMLTCILNYEVWNGTSKEIKHVVLVAFRGTQLKEPQTIVTDLLFNAQKGNSGGLYHSGFLMAAQKHYTAMQNNVFYSLGNGEAISFSEYLNRMCSDDSDYSMIITGHSLGAGVANVFTSQCVNTFVSVNGKTPQKNAVAYTYASPLTCSEDTKKIRVHIIFLI